MPDFGPSQEERAYQGDPTSKEDMAAHTARMAALLQEQVHYSCSTTVATLLQVQEQG